MFYYLTYILYDYLLTSFTIIFLSLLDYRLTSFTIAFIFFTETADVSILRFPGAKFGKILRTRTMRTKGILADITDANIKIRIYINKNRYFRLPFDGFVLHNKQEQADFHI